MNLVFLRPEWFLGVLPVVLMAVWYWRGKRGSRSWATVIDARLLPHLLSHKKGRSLLWPFVLMLFVAALAIVALAGPVWEKLSQPVFKQQSALVVALDLSASMNAADIKPSRLERARHKLTDLLKRRKEGQTALIAYAASPFTVTPLTDDFGTILSLLPSLTTDLMPAQGSRADLAVAKAIELLDNAGLARGDILLITDGINDDSLKQIQERHMPGFRVSLLAVGTEHGAPARTAAGDFIKNRSGSIVVARSDFERMAQLAQSKDGLFHVMRLDDSDILSIEALVNSGMALDDHQQTEFEADQWREEGPWLLLLITPLAALAFRRGLLLPLLLVVVVLPVAEPALAEPGWWQRLWNNKDQLGQQALQQGNADEAASLFKDNDWKAAAQYRAGEYEQALQHWQQQPSAEANYNRGNALANLGKLEQALESYEQALQQNPDHADAAYNRDLVKQAIEQQQQQQQSSQQKPRDKEEDEEQKEEEKEDNKDDKQEGEEKQEQQKQGDGKSSDNASEGEQKDQQTGDQQQNQSQAGEQNNKNQQPRDSDDEHNEDPSSQDSSEQSAEGKPQPSAQEQDAEKQQSMAEEKQQENNLQQADPEQQMTDQAETQWLRRIPDDPGGLLRNKFRYQYSRQRSATQERELW